MSKVHLNDGELTINLYDIFQNMNEEERSDLVRIMAWESDIYEQVCEFTKKEPVREWGNRKLFEIRTSFLASDEAPDIFKNVVREMMQKVEQAEKKAKAWENVYWELFKWNSDRRGDPLPVKTPEYIPVVAKTDVEVSKLVDAISSQAN